MTFLRLLLLPALLAVSPTLVAAPAKPLHVMLQGASADEMATLVRDQGGELTHHLGIINAVGARLSRQQLEAILDTGKVDRHIDDLALSDQPTEAPPAEAGCQVAGAVEISQTGNHFAWRLYNKGGKPQKLRELELRWPERLGMATSIALGKQPLPIQNAATEGQLLTLAFSEDRAPTLSGQQELTVSFEQSPQPVPAQSEYDLTLSFGIDCDVSLIPGYRDNADNYYYSQVSGAEALHRHGVRGNGVTVAVLDSGLWDHPNLLNDSQGRQRVKARYDAINHSEGDVFDESGHGSHLTSILAHSGATLSAGTPTGGYKGIAPDASIVAIKAFDESGQGGLLDIVRGVQWAVDNREKYNIRVLNLSFSARPRWPYFLDPINQAVMRAWSAGITVVAAAGNSGPKPMTVGSPGNLPYIITVGAVTDSWTADTRTDDYVPDFSSRGPTPEAHIKPDIVAPGGHMTGLTRPGSGLVKQHPEYQLPGGELVMTGTSQAAALVSGLVALLLQLEPDLSPDDVKCKLLSTAEPAINTDGLLAYSPFQQGHGYVSITRAITLGDRGCGNADLNLSRDMAGEEHFEGPAIVAEDQQITLPGLKTMLSPLPSAKGASDTRVWGVKAHVERLAPDYQPPPQHPFDWVQMYEFERSRIQKLSRKP
ncbi:alkaline serine protease [Seongchinamella unica]|uniref:Alkaline serine protease n=1 Tax=Seongchinamella unica TaxID=2547392 RepID=A0A4R5LV01_9GAMM|nr:S8 family peptidase [Seongchinamella unica]TDG15157.1 alkaline serine protease [Seongchinamella unica]